MEQGGCASMVGANDTVDKIVMGGAGLADEVGLLARTMNGLSTILQLTKMYCEKYQLKLVGS